VLHISIWGLGDGTEFWASCVARQLTCGYLSDADNRIFRLNTEQILANWLYGFVSTNTRDHRKILRENFEKRYKQKPTKNKKNKYQNTS